jgi:hypothetical protein
MKIYYLVLIVFLSFNAFCNESGDGTSGDYDYLTHQRSVFNLQCMGLDKVSAIKGTCFWLKISFLKVQLKTSLIIEHRVPDLTFEARASSKDSVLEPINWVLGFNQAWSKFLLWGTGLFADGNVRDAMSDNKTSSGTRINNLNEKKVGDNLNFYDVTVIGNPYLPLYELVLENTMSALQIGSYCPSKVTPFMPYYVSISDPEWRFGIYERFLSLFDTATTVIGEDRNINNTPFALDLSDPMKTVDKLLNADNAGVYWGYIYPRMGYIKNSSMYRSAAIMVQRAADIGTGDHGLHIPSPRWMPNEPDDRGRKVWPIPKVREHDDYHAWQLNYPQGEKEGCYQFPDKDFDKDLVNTDLVSETNSYIWTLWRTYKCCEKKGQVYLGKIEW